MPDPKITAVEAEKLIVEYAAKINCKTPKDLANILELLISKSARAIEKYCGNDIAVSVCERTASYIAKKPAVKNNQH